MAMRFLRPRQHILDVASHPRRSGAELLSPFGGPVAPTAVGYALGNFESCELRFHLPPGQPWVAYPPASVLMVEPHPASFMDLQPDFGSQAQRRADGLGGLERPQHCAAIEPADPAAAFAGKPVPHIRPVQPVFQMCGYAFGLRLAGLRQAGIRRSRALPDKRIVRRFSVPNQIELRHSSQTPCVRPLPRGQ